MVTISASLVSRGDVSDQAHELIDRMAQQATAVSSSIDVIDIVRLKMMSKYPKKYPTVESVISMVSTGVDKFREDKANAGKKPNAAWFAANGMDHCAEYYSAMEQFLKGKA